MFASVLLAGCGLPPGPGPADFSAELPGDYFLHRTSTHQIKISPMSSSDETPVIPPKVVGCAVVGHLVLARRQRLRDRSPDDPLDDFRVPEPGAFDYWILDTAGPEVFGPMSSDRFEAMRRQLGVPDSVELRDIESLRPLTNRLFLLFRR